MGSLVLTCIHRPEAGTATVAKWPVKDQAKVPAWGQAPAGLENCCSLGRGVDT